MSEAGDTVTCASCGKQFKGSPGDKKFHCASCHDVTAVGGQTTGNAGKILCGSCWSSMELREELYKTSQGIMGGDGNGPGDERLIDANRQLEERLTEMQTRLMIEEEGRTNALRERDIASEARGKLEKTLAEFLSKFAKVREAEVVAVKERDTARDQCKALERKIKDMETQVSLAHETEASAMAERNNAATAKVELDLQIADMQRQLTASQEALAAERGSQRDRKNIDEKIMELESQVAHARENEAALASERTAAAKAQAELELKVNDLKTKLSAAEAQLAEHTSQGDDKAHELEVRTGELHGELVAAQFENMSICAERDMAVTARQEMEAKIADLNERLTKAVEAQNTARKERDEAGSKSAGDAAKELAEVRAELGRLREAAVSALEPLGMECNTKMKDLMSEAEQVVMEARQAREDATNRLEQLEKMASALRGNINLARRHVTGRVSMVLGSPAGESGFTPALKAGASQAQNKAVSTGSGTRGAVVAAAGE